MNVAMIGTGYVGLPTSVGLAELGHNVICIDREEHKIEALRSGKITLYEKDLEELFSRNVQAGRLHFTTHMQEGVSQADIVIIGVGTPPHPVTKEADMKYVHAAAIELAEYLQGYTVVATKSTVPVGAGDDVEILIKKKNSHAQVDVISLPEFLREGYAVYDFFHPDRIVVGINSERAGKLIEKLYAPLLGRTKLLFVSRRSAEIIKYASNAFLAVKIHYINELADFCEKTGADIREVAEGMGLDSRIGAKFLNPGPGFGGSCFPKDTLAMIYMARQNNLDMSLIDATVQGNNKRKAEMAERILRAVKGIDNAKIGVWGLAFKNGTDDCRESPAVSIIAELLNYPVQIIAYDPKAAENAKLLFGHKIQYAESMYEAAADADVLAVLTEWEEFKSADIVKLRRIMKGQKIIDCRNLLDKDLCLKNGFVYQGVGR